MRTLRLLSVLALFLTACSDAGSAVETPSSQSLAVQARTPERTTGLVEKMMHAPSSTSYRGLRKVSYRVYDRVTGTEQLTYLEEVLSDGKGMFAVTPEQLIEPKLDQGRLEIFKLVQKGREEFFYNHRDFRVRDLDLFLSNYLVTVEGSGTGLLSRETMDLSIQRRTDGESRYELEVDRETGLVLMQREFDLQDRLVSEVEYVELTVGDLTPANFVRLRGSTNGGWRQAAPRDGLDGLQVGPPLAPPSGFQLLEQRIVTDPLGLEWYELIYGDGVEQLFLLYALSPTRSAQVLAAGEVLLYRHGSWTVAEGLLNGERVIALGKVSRDALILTLESCL